MRRATLQESSVIHLIQKLSLKANFSWALIGNFIDGFCQWGILVVIVKMGTPEMVGAFALGIAVCAPIMNFALLDLRTVQATDTRDDFLFSSYINLSTITATTGLIIIIGITLGFYNYGNNLSVIIFLGLFKLMENISMTYYGLFQKNEKMNYIAISLIVKGFLSLLMVILIMYFYRSIVFATLSLAFSWGLVMLLYDKKIADRILSRTEYPDGKSCHNYSETKKIITKSYMEPAILKKLFLLSLPLGFALLIASLNANIPRYFVERFLNLRDLGIFTAMVYLAAIGIRFVMSLMQAFMPRLAKYFNTLKKKEFYNLYIKQLIIVVTTGLASLLLVALFGKQLVAIIYTAEYVGYSDILIWVMIFAFFEYMCIFLRNIMIISRLLKTDMAIRCVSLFILVLMCAIFIPTKGLFGAIIAMVSYSITCFVGSAVINFIIIRKFKTRSSVPEVV